MVKEIISQAQHILWAPAILLVLPPVALFTKKALCISSEYRKEHFCQEPKGMKRNPFFFFGGAEGYENHLVFYFWTDFHIQGHLREVRLLRPTSSQGERQSLTGTQTMFHPLRHPRHSLSSLAPRLSRGKGKKCRKETENKKKIPLLLLCFSFFFCCFKACNSLLCPRVN